MRAQTWLSTSASLCFLFSIPIVLTAGSAAAAAQPFPQECIDAGAKNKQECDDLLKKAGKGEMPATAAASNAAAPTANEPAPAPTPAPTPPVPTVKVVVLPPDCVAAGLTTQSDCDALHAAGAAKKGKEKPPAEASQPVSPKAPAAALAPATPSAPPPAADNSNAEQTVNSGKAVKGARLAKDCLGAGITTQADCDALHALNVAKKSNAKAKTPVDASQAAPVPTAAAAPAPVAPTPATVNPTVENGPAATALAQDCIAAGLTTQADCDALHALSVAKKGNAKAKKPVDASQAAPAPAAPVAPTPATVNPTVDNGPATPTPADKVTPATGAGALAADCIAAGLTTQADCDALHALSVAKKGDAKAKKPVDASQAAPAPATAAEPAPVAPTPATVNPTVDNGPATRTPADKVTPATGAVAEDCVAAGLKTVADCDALHAINAQKGKGKLPADASQAAPAAPAAAVVPATPKPGVTPPVAQPLEVVPTLPKGVTADQVAPLLDSAKVPEKSGKGPVAPATSQVVAAPATPPPPPPTSDKSAQADIKLTKVAPIEQVKGQQVDPKANLQVQVPQNVTIVNQTIVNNTTTTNTTNNTTVAPDAGPKGKPTDHPADTAMPDGNHPRNAIGLSFGLVLQLGTQLIISSPARDQYRIANNDRDRTDYEQLAQDRYRETITRPDGVRIVTVYNRYGDILRRSRFDRDGREIVLAYFDESRDQDLLQWRDPGDDLPPLRLSIPAQDYVLDAGQADEGQVARFFVQPPVERVQRLYSISEVKRSARIRDMVRRLEIGDLTFDTGSATLSPDQIPALGNVANAMLQLLQQNPAETFLIEGHTDAVGSDVANLQLSDARAAAVAQILTDAYHIPPENLTTQGYGAQFLKVATSGPERINRRVTIRRITPLVTVANGP